MSILHVTAKCVDRCVCQLENKNGQIEIESDSYVPTGINIGGDDDDGDYIDISIDIETGQILNWKPLTEDQVFRAIAKKG